MFDAIFQFLPAVLGIVAGVVILILYRSLVSDEYEPLPVAFTLVGLVDILIITLLREPEKRGILAVPLILFFLYAVLIVTIFRRQRNLTEEHIAAVLKNEANLVTGISPTCEDVYKWIEIGRAVVVPDIFPGGWLGWFETNLGGHRRRRRQLFYDMLPASTFKKHAFSADAFIIPENKRRSLQGIYAVTCTVSMGTLVWTMWRIVTGA